MSAHGAAWLHGLIARQLPRPQSAANPVNSFHHSNFTHVPQTHRTCLDFLHLSFIGSPIYVHTLTLIAGFLHPSPQPPSGFRLARSSLLERHHSDNTIINPPHQSLIVQVHILRLVSFLIFGFREWMRGDNHDTTTATKAHHDPIPTPTPIPLSNAENDTEGDNIPTPSETPPIPITKPKSIPQTHPLAPKDDSDDGPQSTSATHINATEIQEADDLALADLFPTTLPLADPQCQGMSELAEASQLRARVSKILQARVHAADSSPSSSASAITAEPGSLPVDGAEDKANFSDMDDPTFSLTPLFTHLATGLAYTPGSALGSTPPIPHTCLATYLIPNRARLTAGARAWAKHSHRSESQPDSASEATSASEETATAADSERAERMAKSAGWWGSAKGPVGVVNERARALFWKVMRGATWRNLHWLPHRVLVYEVRVAEGYGMRWAQDQCTSEGEEGVVKEDRPWMFRGFLEPTMENGHELKWRHPISPPPPSRS